MAGKALLMLVAAAALLNVAAAGPLIEYMKKTKDLTTAASVLEQLYPKPIDPKTKLTLFAPTNEAIEAFRSDLRLTPAQFKDRKGLLDLVVAYHILPGYQAKELKIKDGVVGVTGDINHLLRFYNSPKGVLVEDEQGNNVTLGQPVVIGNAAVVPINRVLMSGSYFFDGKAALKYYPQWSKAREFAEAVGYPEGTAREQDMTLLVPDNKGMEAAAGVIAKLSKEQQKNVFLYHVSQPARLAPTDFKDGSKISTNFKGHDITVATSVDSSKIDSVTGKPNAVPTMTFTSETGNKATTKIFNIIVGRSFWQGIDAVLVPKLDGGVQTESGAKTGRRLMAAWAESVISAVSGSGRRLKYRGYAGGGDSSQMYANQVSQDNTARAIEAAATGQIPTSYATRYGSLQAKNAADNCLNCNWN